MWSSRLRTVGGCTKPQYRSIYARDAEANVRDKVIAAFKVVAPLVAVDLIEEVNVFVAILELLEASPGVLIIRSNSIRKLLLRM